MNATVESFAVERHASSSHVVCVDEDFEFGCIATPYGFVYYSADRLLDGKWYIRLDFIYGGRHWILTREQREPLTRRGAATVAGRFVRDVREHSIVAGER